MKNKLKKDEYNSLIISPIQLFKYVFLDIRQVCFRCLFFTAYSHLGWHWASSMCLSFICLLAGCCWTAMRVFPLCLSVSLSLFDVSVESGRSRAGSHVHQLHPSSSGPGGRERMTGSREGADVLQELICVHIHEGCHYAADRETCSWLAAY